MVYIGGFTDAICFKNTGKNNCFERVCKITFQMALLHHKFTFWLTNNGFFKLYMLIP